MRPVRASLYSTIPIAVLMTSHALAGEFTLRFDGHDDAVVIPSASSLNLSSAFTVECWMRPSGLPAPSLPNARHLLDKGGAWTRNYAMWLNGYKVVAATHTSAGEVLTQSSATLENGRWYHVAMVADGTELRLYVDGVLGGSISAGGPYSIYNNAALTLGRRGTENDMHLSGRMDECRISNLARYTTNFTPACAFDVDGGTVGLWKFDEGTGGTLHDASANHNDGSIAGAAWEVGGSCSGQVPVPASSAIGLLVAAAIMALLARRGVTAKA